MPIELHDDGGVVPSGGTPYAGSVYNLAIIEAVNEKSPTKIEVIHRIKMEDASASVVLQQSPNGGTSWVSIATLASGLSWAIGRKEVELYHSGPLRVYINPAGATPTTIAVWLAGVLMETDTDDWGPSYETELTGEGTIE